MKNSFMDTTVKVDVEVTFITPMLGTVPKDPEIYKTFIESKKPASNNGEDEYMTVEKTEEKGWTGFRSDKQGLFIYEYMVKGFLKNAGNVLKDTVKVKALKSKIDNFVFIAPRKIYLGQSEADGVEERPIRAMTAQGPRVSVVRSDYISEGKTIQFSITLLNHKEVTWDLIADLLRYGTLMGLGQFRNGGYGRFEVANIS